MPVTRTQPNLTPGRVAALQMRTVGVLTGAQVFSGVGIAVTLSAGTLLAQQITDSGALIGLVPTAVLAGAALSAFPLARFASRQGRRPALAVGYLLGVVGSLLVTASAQQRSYPLIVLGHALMGMGMVSNQQSRYAAADMATDANRGLHLSVVVWATTVGAVGGSNMLGVSTDAARSAGLPPLAGPYVLALVAYFVSAMVVLALLRPDPLLVARSRAGVPSAPPKVPFAAALRAVGRSRPAVGAVVAMTTAQAMMMAVMSFTPVQMHMGGAMYSLIGLAISLHVAAMYGLAPVMGWLTDHFGRTETVRLGLLLTVAACVAAALVPASSARWLIVGLVLLGLGWSAVLVAGSTLLTESVAVPMRPAAQGVFDVVMNLGGMAGSSLGGVAMQVFGFRGMAGVSGGLAAVVTVITFMMIGLDRSHRIPAPASAPGGATADGAAGPGAEHGDASYPGGCAVKGWQVSRRIVDVPAEPQQNTPANVAVISDLDAALAAFPDVRSWVFEAQGKKLSGLDEFRKLADSAGAVRPGDFVARGQYGHEDVIIEPLS